jgi:hypothetical protein
MSGHQEIKRNTKYATGLLTTAIRKRIAEVSSLGIPNSNVFQSVTAT